MINLKYILHPSYCGYFCLRHVIGKVKCEKKSYMSMYSLCEILKKYNYYCSCVRVNKIDDLLFDCVTLIKVNDVSYHYIVLKKKRGKYIYYYDPLFMFIRRIKINKFVNKWCKVCLFYTKV